MAGIQRGSDLRHVDLKMMIGNGRSLSDHPVKGKIAKAAIVRIPAANIGMNAREPDLLNPVRIQILLSHLPYDRLEHLPPFNRSSTAVACPFCDSGPARTSQHRAYRSG